jgi:uncharacterized membrane protein
MKTLMKLLNREFKVQTHAPLLALTFATGVSVVLVVARIAWTGNVKEYGFLVWNLFLAWLPLVFALLASDAYGEGGKGKWRFGVLGAAWLLFFPNAPYIFTDLTHLANRYYGHFWIDLVLFLLCALTGLILGFVSLYLMQAVVARMLGRALSWLFVAATAAASGFGIYLGRFLRFNSWDVLYKPVALYHGIGSWAADPLAHPTTYAFPALFATFLFISYLLLYALTHMRPMQALTVAREPATET